MDIGNWLKGLSAVPFWPRVALLVALATGLTILIGTLARVPVFFSRDRDDSERLTPDVRRERDNKLKVLRADPKQFAAPSEEPD
jgi:hypothetical protein